MGSKSDQEILVASGFLQVVREVLGSDEVEVSICSAHRNAPDLAVLAEQAVGEGAKVFVGIAGLAAALPGALAGLTGMTVPVIAVPLDEHGIDSCLYMPPGVPVALAGVGKTGLKNAALLACQILALTSGEVHEKLMDYLEATEKPARFNVDIPTE